MTEQKKKAVLEEADPLELATLVHILSACSSLVTLALNIPMFIDNLTRKDRVKDRNKWRLELEELNDRHEEYKWLVKEILLALNELEPGFGEKEIKAGNLLLLADRNSFYRFLELRRDLAKLAGEMEEAVHELDKFVIENDSLEIKLNKGDELLVQFDRVMSLWGKATFNDFARELKSLNRSIEKRIGRVD